jgi:hypothetical protein
MSPDFVTTQPASAHAPQGKHPIAPRPGHPQPTIETVRPGGSPARPGARPKTAREGIGLFLRRLHLYSGLFLLPWVLLYGVTAFLFNHPGAFSERSVDQVSGDALARHGIVASLDPAALAADAAGRARVPNSQPADATIRLGGEAPRLRGRLRVERGDGNQRASLSVDLERNTASLLVFDNEMRARQTRNSVPLAKKSETREEALASVRASAGALLDELGAPPGEIEIKNLPMVVAGFETGAGMRPGTYDVQKDRLTVESADALEKSESVRDVLTGLHKAHGYESSVVARSAWAFFVDAMAFAMVSWAATGLLMSFQLKKLRKPILITLAASAVVAAALGYAMVVR